MKKSLLVVFCVTLLSASPAHADPIFFGAFLTGAAEDVPTGSPGLGVALISYDPALHLMGVLAAYQGLTAPVTAAHIHCCVDPPGTAGVATPLPTFPGFPTDPAGVYMQSFDLTDLASYNPAFVLANGGSALAAELGLSQGLASGRAYFNIHTSAFRSGEIRGFLTALDSPDPIPEPTSFVLLATGLLGAAGVRRWRRRKV